ncbi:MAG: DUF1501 domain-containing protein [Verrucomicrobiaceae bacterium]|nr:DUF1501 domain-containing protein [Verrucomicrobiaceae bacterium]
MNPFQDRNILTRRSFLTRAVYTGVGAAAATHTIRDLRLINAAMAQSSGSITGYKALICLFLNGGNDSNNWVVPTTTSAYNAYAGLRGILALPQSSLMPLNDQGTTPYTDADGHTYGFHPSCGKLQTLFGEDKLAVTFNVGTLVRPITRAEYMGNATGTRPPQLFSHSDQVTQWQTSIPDQPPATGWGGRCADLLNATANPTGKISMSVSLNGSNTYEVGRVVQQYHVSSTGAVTLSNLSAAKLQTMRNIFGHDTANLQRSVFGDVMERAVATGELLNTSIQATAMATDAPPGTWVWNTPFPTSGLGTQLKMIARIIQARGPTAFDMKRQIFFCSVGGYDTHTNQVTFNTNGTVTSTTGTHANLLNDVSESLFAFQRAMEQLGVSDSVTTFTASDFARTFPTNSQGSDHGWGGHHIIAGGAVKGGRTYGHLPVLALGGPQDTGLGRWLPTTAVDQHAATLARWFGVSESSMATVFPNLSRFSGTEYGSDVGFMKPA